MVRAVMLVLGIAFTHNLYAKPPLDVSKFHRQYLAENRVLLYLGKHVQSDRVAIWGQAALTEDIVRFLLKSPLDIKQMEELLRSSGNSWEGNYDNYHLYDFMLSEPDQSDSFFAQVVKNSSELILLDGYVDRIEEVDGVTKFFDKHSKEVFPVENGKISKCAMAEGDACYLLYRSFLDYEDLKPQEKELIAYLEENIELLEGDGIVIAEMADELGFKNVKSLGWVMRRLKNALSEDTDHFVHRIVRKAMTVDGEYVNYYRFADAITPQEKELIVYLEGNQSLLDGDGIINTKIIEKIGFKSGIALGHAISRLKKKLSEDTDHIIHRIAPEKWWDYDKHVVFYRFTDAMTFKEKELIAYLEENKHLLEGDGIANTEIIEEIGFRGGIALGYVIGRLKKKLSEDTDHLIHMIVPKVMTVDGEYAYVYRITP